MNSNRSNARLTRRVLAVVTATGVVAALAACSSSSSASSPEAASDEVVSLTVGAAPSIFSTAMHLGVNEGIFEDAGFDVTIQPIQSMSEGIPLLLQGTAQYIVGDVQNTILAGSEDVPIAIGAPSTVTATETPEDNIGFGALLALEDSVIESVEDVEGKTIGTNTIGGDAYMSYLQLFEEEGVDTSTINWVEIPGPQLLPSLRQKQVDAVTIGEPNLTVARLEGGVKTVANADAVMNGAPQFAWLASQQWLGENADVAKRFQAAVIEANELAASDRAKAEEALASYTELPPEVISEVYFPHFSGTPITPGDLETTVDRMIKYELITEDEVPDLTALVPTL